MALDGSLNAALLAPAPLVFCALEIVLPNHTIRVLDGAGAIGFNGMVFQGFDATYGSLNGIESITESVGTEAPRVRFTFLPRSNNALAGLASPGNQGAAVTMWIGAVIPQTGLVIGQPEPLFVGELDESSFDYDEGSGILTMDCGSAWDRFFEGNEGARQTDAFQQSIYPGDLAFRFITGVDEQLYWGYNA